MNKNSTVHPSDELEVVPMGVPVKLDHTDIQVAQISREDVTSPQRTKFQMTMIILALTLSLFVAALLQTSIGVAIPTITSDLKSATGYTWIGGAYLLANAACGPVWAKLSDIWGRKPILLAAVAMFFLCSIICAVAQDMRTLIVGRALQGTASGGLHQLVYITISDICSMKSRSLVFGFLEVMWGVAGGTGPLLGGAFTEYTTWRWMFWMNLPICGIAFALLFFFLDVHNPRTGLVVGLKAVDWIGSLSIIAVTLMILLGLDFGGATFAWSSPQVVCLLVFGCVAIGIFLFGEKKVARYPLMPLSLFKDKHNVATLLVTFCHGMVYMGLEYYLPLYFQSAKSAAPLKSGALLLPFTLMEALCGIMCGLLMHKFGCYTELIWVGTTLMTIGAGLLISITADTPTIRIIGFQTVVGAGLGMLFQPVVVAIQVFVKQNDVATATATSGFVRNIATCLGVVFGGVIFQNGQLDQRNSLIAVGLPADIVQKIAGPDAAANVNIAGTIEDAGLSNFVRRTFAHSISKMFIFYTSMAGVSVLASVFVRRAKLSSEHTETKTGLLKDDASIPLQDNPSRV